MKVMYNNRTGCFIICKKDNVLLSTDPPCGKRGSPCAMSASCCNGCDYAKEVCS